ncbi:hypothetical protein EDD37DRAFT_609513 [Exophiala viscosa]|uniref:uncharacterized protein n=1 Tax=Exophiala viscosa TaxID=2486360 RepID=UPI00219C1AE5|nr:hypothetical protein EDD37DRAFT_609513 [Exophiala viscosa]
MSCLMMFATRLATFILTWGSLDSCVLGAVGGGQISAGLRRRPDSGDYRWMDSSTVQYEKPAGWFECTQEVHDIIQGFLGCLKMQHSWPIFESNVEDPGEAERSDQKTQDGSSSADDVYDDARSAWSHEGV